MDKNEPTPQKRAAPFLVLWLLSAAAFLVMAGYAWTIRPSFLLGRIFGFLAAVGLFCFVWERLRGNP